MNFSLYEKKPTQIFFNKRQFYSFLLFCKGFIKIIIIKYMKKSTLLIFVFLVFVNYAKATEGMWIPSLINMFYSDMKTNGLKLKAEDIYATNKSSLKDAIVQFDGGCTAEIVSAEGLLLTNHHCGYDAIQKLSSLEKDYLKNGFWAKNKSEELACPWMYVTFVKEIREVSKEVLAGVKTEMALAERNALIKKNIAEIEKKTAVTGNIKAKIKPLPIKFTVSTVMLNKESEPPFLLLSLPSFCNCKQRFII